MCFQEFGAVTKVGSSIRGSSQHFSLTSPACLCSTDSFWQKLTLIIHQQTHKSRHTKSRYKSSQFLQGLMLNLIHHMLQGLTFGAFLNHHLHMQPDPVMLQYLAWKASCGKERHIFREIWSSFQPQDLISLQGICCEGCVVTGTWNKLLVLLSSWSLKVLWLFGIHVYNSRGEEILFQLNGERIKMPY